MMGFVQDASSSRRAAGRVFLTLFDAAKHCWHIAQPWTTMISLVCCNKKCWEGNCPTDDKFRLDGSGLSKTAWIGGSRCMVVNLLATFLFFDFCVLFCPRATFPELPFQGSSLNEAGWNSWNMIEFYLQEPEEFDHKRCNSSLSCWMTSICCMWGFKVKNWKVFGFRWLKSQHSTITCQYAVEGFFFPEC